MYKHTIFGGLGIYLTFKVFKTHDILFSLKVGGQTLCLLCTINFKKAQFKKKMQEGKKEVQNMLTTTTTTTRTLKHRDRHRDDE